MKYNLTCEPVDYSDDPDATRVIFSSRISYFS